MLDYMDTTITALLLASITLLAGVYSLWRDTQGLRYPPGPPGHFIIGNALDIPREKRHIAFALWAKQYKSTFPAYTRCEVLRSKLYIIRRYCLFQTSRLPYRCSQLLDCG